MSSMIKSVIAIKPKTKENLRMAAMLPLHILKTIPLPQIAYFSNDYYDTIFQNSEVSRVRHAAA
jgi:hypothetical protein